MAKGVLPEKLKWLIIRFFEKTDIQYNFVIKSCAIRHRVITQSCHKGKYCEVTKSAWWFAINKVTKSIRIYIFIRHEVLTNIHRYSRLPELNTISWVQLVSYNESRLHFASHFYTTSPENCVQISSDNPRRDTAPRWPGHIASSPDYLRLFTNKELQLHRFIYSFQAKIILRKLIFSCFLQTSFCSNSYLSNRNIALVLLVFKLK